MEQVTEINYRDLDGNKIAVTVEGEALDNILAVPVAEILADTTQNTRLSNKTDAKAIEALALDIQEQGQIQPVVAFVNSDGRLELIAGFRRFAAIKRLNEQGIPTLVKVMVVDQLDAPSRRRMNVAENVQRQSLSVVEEAQAIRAMQADGMSRDAIAQVFGKSKAWVTTRGKILNLPQEVLIHVHEGRITGDTAYELAQMDEKDRNKWLAKFEKDGSLSYDSVRTSRAVAKSKAAGEAEGETEAGEGESGEGEGDAEAVETVPTAVRPRPSKVAIQFFDSYADPNIDSLLSETGRALAKAIAKYMANKLSEKAMLKKLREI